MSGLLDGLRSTTPTATGLGLDDLCHVLMTSRRRFVIEWFEDADVTAKDELAEHVAFVEHGVEYTRSDRKNAYVALHQTHVPALKEYDVLEGPDTALRPGPNHAAVADALHALEERLAATGGSP